MVGEQIRLARRRRSISQEQLAYGLCDRSYISLVEHGKVQPGIDLLRQLCQRLGIALTDLLEEEVTVPWPSAIWTHCQSLLRQGQFREAYLLLRSLWWDASVVTRGRLLNGLEPLLLKMADATIPDTAVLQSAFYVSLSINRWDIAYRIGPALQRHLFYARRWPESLDIGQFLIRSSSDIGMTLDNRVYVAAGSAALNIGLLEIADSLYSTVVDHSGSVAAERDIKGWALHGCGAVEMHYGRWETARAPIKEALRTYEAHQDEERYFDALQNEGIIAAHLDGRAAARSLLMRVYRYWEQRNSLKANDVMNDMRMFKL